MRGDPVALGRAPREGGLYEAGICDRIVPEPPGGAHSDWDAAARELEQALGETLDELGKLSPKKLLAQRWAKYEAIGAWRVD